MYHYISAREALTSTRTLWHAQLLAEYCSSGLTFLEVSAVDLEIIHLEFSVKP